MKVKYISLGLQKKYISLRLLLVWKRKGVLYFMDLGGWKDRNSSMINLLKESLCKDDIKNFSPVIINTGDRPINSFLKLNLYSFTTTDGYYDKIIPDWTYDSWSECGIPDFNIITKEIEKMGKIPPKMSKIGRIGNFNTSTSRLILAKLSAKYPQYLDIKDSNTTDYISLPELIRDYKYLIDVEGIGFSGRLKYLFFSGRPIFVQERIWKEYALMGAIPYKDYIPVKNDFSDLIENFEKYSGSVSIDQIGKNGQNFAIKTLSKANAYKYIHNEFINLKKFKFNNFKVVLFIGYKLIKVLTLSIINKIFRILKIKKSFILRR